MQLKLVCVDGFRRVKELSVGHLPEENTKHAHTQIFKVLSTVTRSNNFPLVP